MLRNLFRPTLRDFAKIGKNDNFLGTLFLCLLIAALCAPATMVKKKSKGWLVFWVFLAVAGGILALSYLTHGTWVNS